MTLLGGIFKDLTLGGVKGLFEGVGALAKDIRSAITGDISPEKKAELEAKLIEIDALSKQGQLEINMQESRHSSVFVSGWRPAIGWVCAVGLGCYFIPQYAMAAVLWVKASWNAQAILPYPIPNAEGLLELVGGMLGMALIRASEKIKGVARS